jgi:uncharacterized protein
VAGGLNIALKDSAALIDADDWNACAGNENPFLSHAFFLALEHSGSATAERGWLPQHFVLSDDSGGIVAILPCYLKGHSQGEYVFDHNWAHAYEAAGGKYYPKLQSSIPFTPVTARRLLVRQAKNAGAHGLSLIRAVPDIVERFALSSFHATFLLRDEARMFANEGYLIRDDIQYHWRNYEFNNFEDFLKSLSARKRKVVRRERKQAIADDMKIELLTGAEIEEHHWDAFFTFYQDTGARKWGQPYLTREFFSLIGESMGDSILLVMCRRAGHYIAGALNFKSDEALYGRYWGAIETHRFLHFEICYYQAMDFAITHGIQRVEAGAQGEHKIARGYEPVKTHSAHYLRDPGFRDAVALFLKDERQLIDFSAEQLKGHLPFKKPPPP